MDKYREVYDYLLRYIDRNKFSVHNKLPSEYSLSRRFFVCRETVRRAIGLLRDDGLVYSVHGSGTYFSKEKAFELRLEDGKTDKVAIIVQGKDREAAESFIKAVDAVMGEKGFETRVFYTENRLSNERKCLRACVSGFKGIIVDGVKASMMNPNGDIYERLYGIGIPILFYNNYYSETKFPKIINDDEKCAEALISILAESGHRDIAGIFLYDNYQGVRKYLGCTSAIFRHALVFDDDYSLFLMTGDLDDEKRTEKRIWNFYKKISKKCTAIVCCNVMLYRTVKKILGEKGVKIPDDVSIVCFDYSNDDYDEEGVTCSVHQGDLMGRTAAEVLCSMIGDPDYKTHDYSVLINPKIMPGRTVGDIRKK